MVSTFKRDLIREYLSHLEVERGLSANSRESYRRDLLRLDAWAGKQSKALESLERADISAWLADLSRENSLRLLAQECCRRPADSIVTCSATGILKQSDRERHTPRGEQSFRAI
jgi:site-specific recombinase XerC